jgi:Uma2 family endonuclease
MAAQPIPRLTPEQYLEIERGSDRRHEYFNGEMLAMSGGSLRQSVIIFNLGSELRIALKPRRCTVTGQDMRTSVAYAGLYTYPDIVVICDEPQYVDNRQDTITNPSLIIEVLSPSTEAYDRGAKFAQYRKIDSLQEYALVSQTEARVEIFRRQPNGQWVFSDFVGLEATCVFESIECRVPLAEVYDKVTLGDPDGGAFPGPPNSAGPI